MKASAVVLILLSVSVNCFAYGFIEGYTAKDGTHVNGYTRSDKDSSYNNNHSTRVNTNHYTGESGTNNRTYNDRTPEYYNKKYGMPGYESSYGSPGSSNPENSHKSRY